MKKAELTDAFNKMFEGTDLVDDLEAADTNAELAAIVEGEATLSEEFKEKTSVIFEVLIKSKFV